MTRLGTTEANTGVIRQLLSLFRLSEIIFFKFNKIYHHTFPNNCSLPASSIRCPEIPPFSTKLCKSNMSKDCFLFWVFGYKLVSNEAVCCNLHIRIDQIQACGSRQPIKWQEWMASLRTINFKFRLKTLGKSCLSEHSSFQTSGVYSLCQKPQGKQAQSWCRAHLFVHFSVM